MDCLNDHNIVMEDFAACALIGIVCLSMIKEVTIMKNVHVRKKLW